MPIAIIDLAKEYNVIPGQIFAVLEDLGIEHNSKTFEADEDILNLIRESLVEMQDVKIIPLTPNKTPRDVSAILGLPQPEIQKTLMTKLKVMATLTTTLKPEAIEKLIGHYGYQVKWIEPKVNQVSSKPTKKVVSQGEPQKRSPVVTIMGHVDHGKTTLLDYIRKSNVAAKEFGGITQHIGAYQVELPEGKITFLDTPGHEAFTAMRARGAQVTDIAILVVSADDGIMPQTIEAIDHAKNAKVPIIVAVNKIDKPGANPDRVLTQLTEHELIPEAYGGQIVVCPVSALTGEGVPYLLEMILLQADLLHLTANPKGEFDGVVIEAKIERGRGPVATVLVQSGTLKVGDSIVVGTTYGRIKAMIDYKGERIYEAGPSVPVEVLGLSNVPNAGDKVKRVDEEKIAREIAEKLSQKERLQRYTNVSKKLTLRDLRRQMEETGVKDLNLVVKTDVQGSLEAVKGLLEKMEHPEVEVKVIHAAVGSITESDVLLASAANAICIGFNVKPEPGAKKEAEKVRIEIRTYSIIYELIEDIQAAVKGMLAPKFEEQYQGTVDIRIVFDLSRYGRVAGSHVTDGKITRNSHVRVKRGKEIVYQGKVDSLKHLKNDVKEMTTGFDCGIQFEGWTGFEMGDQIEAFELVQTD